MKDNKKASIFDKIKEKARQRKLEKEEADKVCAKLIYDLRVYNFKKAMLSPKERQAYYGIANEEKLKKAKKSNQFKYVKKLLKEIEKQ